MKALTLHPAYTLFALNSLILFSSCAHKDKEAMPQSPYTIQKQIFQFKELPKLEGSKDKINLGGFSGLAYEGVNPVSGRKSFLTHTDRGPNSEQELTQDKLAARRFGLADFNPLLVRFELDEDTLSAKITEVKALRSKSGKAISGLPNVAPASKRKDADEIPLNSEGKTLESNASGLDPEAIVITSNGDYWMVEEYRPSILQFGSNGRLKNRYIPIGTRVKGMEAAVEALPATLANRQMNRGFEGLAQHNGKLYAFLQSPLDPKGLEVPVIEFDLKTKKVTGEFSYPLESTKADKIGDAVSIGKNRFLVIEQNSKTNNKSFRKIFEVTLLQGQPLEKKLVADLVELGFSHIEKFEGLTVLGPRSLALISDNDFAFTKPDASILVLLHLDKDLFE